MDTVLNEAAIAAQVIAALRDTLAQFVRPDGVFAPSSSWFVSARA